MNLAGKNLSTKEINALVGGGTYAVIDLDALSHNISAFQTYVGENVRIAVAVKANAYGHGVVPVAMEAIRAGASYLLVARIEEGIQLRLAGITAPILNLGYITPDEMQLALQYNLTLTITQKEQALAAEEAAKILNIKARVHIKVDTGMNRSGTSPEEALPLIQYIDKLNHLELEGLYTHFACADDMEKKASVEQFSKFSTLIEKVKSAGIEIPLIHAANSAATLNFPETHLDMVRIGIASYGLYGSGGVSHAVDLEPILTLNSRIDRIHDLNPGEGVSYGYDFVASQPTRAALVPIGYGDGYQLALSNCGEMLVSGQRAKVLGRICMDQLVIDVTNIKEATCGEPIKIVGQQGDRGISVADLSKLAKISEYSFVTGLSARVPRLYIRNGELIMLTGLNSSSSLRLFNEKLK